MLIVKRIMPMSVDRLHDTGETMLARNVVFKIYVKAPLYWWVDSSFEKYMFYLPTKDFEFSFDGDFKGNIDTTGMTTREIMQVLPLATMVEGVIPLSYQDIIAICENYNSGEFDYHELYNEWPTSREWTDFCETLMDIKDVREILSKEGMLNVE